MLLVTRGVWAGTSSCAGEGGGGARTVHRAAAARDSPLQGREKPLFFFFATENWWFSGCSTSRSMARRKGGDISTPSSKSLAAASAPCATSNQGMVLATMQIKQVQEKKSSLTKRFLIQHILPSSPPPFLFFKIKPSKAEHPDIGYMVQTQQASTLLKVLALFVEGQMPSWYYTE